MTEPGVHPPEERPATSRRSERRDWVRTPVPYLRCWSPAPGAILNVSPMGVGIETSQAFQKGDSIFLATKLPGGADRIVGRVRWCRQIATAGGSASSIFHVGVVLKSPMEEGWAEGAFHANGRTPTPHSH